MKRQKTCRENTRRKKKRGWGNETDNRKRMSGLNLVMCVCVWYLRRHRRSPIPDPLGERERNVARPSSSIVVQQCQKKKANQHSHPARHHQDCLTSPPIHLSQPFPYEPQPFLIIKKGYAFVFSFAS